MPPRLDAARLGVWRDLAALVGEIGRKVDEELLAEWDIGLGWFEVLAALQRRGGAARPHEVAQDLRLPASSLSRRLDRLADEGWIERRREGADGRAVTVHLTRRGRTLWREMNVTYRRAVQQVFAGRLTDRQITDLAEVVEALSPGADQSSPAYIASMSPL